MLYMVSSELFGMSEKTKNWFVGLFWQIADVKGISRAKEGGYVIWNLNAIVLRNRVACDKVEDS